MGKQQQPTSGNGSRTKAKSEKKFNQELDVPPQAYQRYSDVELQMFKELIDNKITELTSTIASSKNEDLSELKPWEKESVLQERTRTENQITALRLALSRIQNKTYGICTVTGKLIPKQRLRLQLTASKTVEAADMAQKPRSFDPKEPNVVPFNQELDINNSDDGKFIKKMCAPDFRPPFLLYRKMQNLGLTYL